MRTHEEMTFIYQALRIAEHAHRTRRRGVQYRKAPAGTDRPAYFVHLTEVAMHLMNCGLDADVVAAGFLHDTIEDTDLTAETLLAAIGSKRVVALVQAVTELDKGQSWERRNRDYLDRLRTAGPDVLALSCADKLCNITDMCLYLGRGHDMRDFTSRGLGAQLAKYEALAEVYSTGAPPALFEPFLGWLERMRAFARR